MLASAPPFPFFGHKALQSGDRVRFSRLNIIMQTRRLWRAQRANHFHVHFASMLTAITRAVSPSIGNCELTYVARQRIELATAEEQHRAYQALLEKYGARVISLPAEPALPDSMFV